MHLLTDTRVASLSSHARRSLPTARSLRQTRSRMQRSSQPSILAASIQASEMNAALSASLSAAGQILDPGFHRLASYLWSVKRVQRVIDFNHSSSINSRKHECMSASAGSEWPHFTMEEDSEEVEGMREEVKLTVPETDNPSLPTLTVRTWIVGFVLCVFLSLVNQFFTFRTSPFAISAITAQIFSLYLGKLMAATLPDSTLLGVRLNPGPFNIKEHVLITVFAHAGGDINHATAKAIDTITLIKVPEFFNKDIPLIAAILLTVSTQLLGYGWAGLLRKFLVEPAQMWWPATLVDVSLFRALHEKESTKGLSRIQFFFIATAASFAWYLLPGYVFTTITSLSWVCWAWKDSVIAHQIGSGLHGLGFMTISLGNNSSNLGFSVGHTMVNYCKCVSGIRPYVMVPAMYAADVYNSQRYPIISNKLFLSDGHRYKVSDVVANDGLTLDMEKYNRLGPPHMTAFYAILHWGLVFASLTATITHVMLWHGKSIYRQYRTTPGKFKPNVHTKLMQKYKDIPAWWFWAMLTANTGIALILVLVWPHIFQLPWWGVIMGFFMSVLFTLPIGVLVATTNRFTGVGPLCDILTGYMLPGLPIANVSFRMYSAESIVQGLGFLRDFKLGQYMKIPPRAMLAVQVSGGVTGGLVNLACAYWMYDNIENLCEEAGAWSCPTTSNSFSVVSLWGLIGSQRLMGTKAEYFALNWFIIAGFVAPIPFWLLWKASKSKKIQDYSRQVNMPVLLGAANNWPPAIAVTYTSWFLTGFIFNFCIFKYHQRWWQRYNYVLSAALDTGVAFGAPLIFFGLLYFHKAGPNWWGNPSKNIDNCPLAFCPTARGINVTAQYPFCPIR